MIPLVISCQPEDLPIEEEVSFSLTFHNKSTGEFIEVDSILHQPEVHREEIPPSDLATQIQLGLKNTNQQSVPFTKDWDGCFFDNYEDYHLATPLLSLTSILSPDQEYTLSLVYGFSLNPLIFSIKKTEKGWIISSQSNNLLKGNNCSQYAIQID